MSYHKKICIEKFHNISEFLSKHDQDYMGFLLTYPIKSPVPYACPVIFNTDELPDYLEFHITPTTEPDRKILYIKRHIKHMNPGIIEKIS